MRPAELGATAISAVTLLPTGSMRESTPLASVTSHTASGLAAIPPSLWDGEIGSVAVTWLVLRSMRESVLSPQFGTQMLPNPSASPEHGCLPTAMAATTVLVFGSSRCTMPLGPLATHTASPVMTCQSGAPGTGKTASGLMADISRFTPGEETPGFGGRGGRFPAASGGDDS